MPVFPFFVVIGAGAVSAFLEVERSRVRHLPKILVGLLVAAIVLIGIMTFPDYTTYFSPLAGGSANGWRVLSDSNVETGQDVKSLAAFIRERGENRIEGLFVGSGYIEYYGVTNCELPCGRGDADNEETDDDDKNDLNQEQTTEPDKQDTPANYIAIGAWYLEEINVTPEQKAVIDNYRSVKPDAVIGNAIFVFRKQPD